MKRHILYFFILLSGIITSQAQTVSQKVQRKDLLKKHWAGGIQGYSQDTLLYRAYKKFDDKFYQWGHYPQGIEFYDTDTAQTFSNILCSTESSPWDSFSTTWSLRGDTLTMDDPYYTTRYRILNLNRKTLHLVVLSSLEKKK